MAKVTGVLVLGCTMALGCAPSHRMVHEGNVYFERCYGADFDPKVRPELREACWSAWLAHYTRHQPSHRVDYALRRIESIQAGEATLELPGLPGGQSKPPVDPTMRDVPHGLPPFAAVQPAPDAGPDETRHGCAQVCADLETQCVAACPPELPTCRDICIRENHLCQKGCY